MPITDTEVKTIINKFDPEVLSTREMESVLERFLFDNGKGEVKVDAFEVHGLSGMFPQHTEIMLLQAFNDASVYYFNKFREQ